MFRSSCRYIYGETFIIEIIGFLKNINYLVKFDNNRNRRVYEFSEVEVNSGDKGEFININITPDRFMNSMSKPLN